MGILILIVLAIGAFVIARFVIRWLFKMIKKSSGGEIVYTHKKTSQRTIFGD